MARIHAGMPLTPSQTVGPFFGFALPRAGLNSLVPEDTPGAIRITGQVLDGAGTPVPDALIELWQTGPEGAYPRSPHDTFTGFGRCPTDAEGSFRFITLKPGPVPAPDGTLQAPHLNVTVFARGLLRHLVTRMYFPDEETANAADPLLRELSAKDRATLIARPVCEDDATNLRFDLRLQGEHETVFYAI